MLARSVMVVVFALNEVISSGRRDPDGCLNTYGICYGYQTVKVPQRRSPIGNGRSGTLVNPVSEKPKFGRGVCKSESKQRQDLSNQVDK